jgi:hypothetical protein
MDEDGIAETGTRVGAKDEGLEELGIAEGIKELGIADGTTELGHAVLGITDGVAELGTAVLGTVDGAGVLSEINGIPSQYELSRQPIRKVSTPQSVGFPPNLLDVKTLN